MKKSSSLLLTYLSRAHKFLVNNKDFLVYYALLDLITNFGTLNYAFDRYHLISATGWIALLIWIYYSCLLPVLFNKKIQNEVLTKASVRNLFFKNTGRILKTVLISFFGFILIIIFISIVYFIFNDIFHSHLSWSDLTNNNDHGFGIYPAKAIFSGTLQLCFSLFVFFPIVYFLEKNNLWDSLRKSLRMLARHISFLFPFILVNIIYYSFFSLFVPDGNYLLLFLKNIFEVYLNLIILTAIFLFYRDNYKNLEIGRAKIKKESRKLNKAIRIILITLIIVLLELLTLIAYTVVINYFHVNLNEKIATWIFIGCFLVIPFLSYLFFYRVSLKTIMLWLLGSFMASVVLFSILVSFELQKENKTKSNLHTGLTSSNLLKAINKKRQEAHAQVLLFEPSTCAIAKVEVETIVEKGLSNTNNNAAFQRSIDKAYRENPQLDSSHAPDWYGEYITYEESVGDALTVWEKSAARSLFIDKEYRFGCVAVKDGYAVVIVGANDPQREQKKSEDSNTPSDYDKVTPLPNLNGRNSSFL